MAQTIKLRRSATASAVPTTGQLALGELAINTFDGKLFLKKDNGTQSIVEVGAGGSASAAGSNTQIQFNNSGAFGASSDFTWDNTGKDLYVNGQFGLGAAVQAPTQFVLGGTMPSSAGASYGINIASTVPAASTAGSAGYITNVSTAAAAFTLPTLLHFSASQGTFGAGSTVTDQYGYYAQGTLTGATNNYGFFGGINAGTGRWNFFAGGTAANYFAGRLNLGSTSTSITAQFYFGGTAPSGTDVYSIYTDQTISAVTTGSASAVTSNLSTAATAFTLPSLNHFVATQGTFGAGSTVTSQRGFYAHNSLTGATNNYGFFSDIAAGTNCWNFYSNGTAYNFFQGAVGTGTGPLAYTQLRIGSTGPSSSNLTYSVYADQTAPATTTSEFASFYSTPSTAASAFTLGTMFHYIATQGTIGAGSAITNQFGFYVANNLTGATNNYGFYSNIPSGTNRWNFYANGTAANYFGGATTFNSTVTMNTALGLASGGTGQTTAPAAMAALTGYTTTATAAGTTALTNTSSHQQFFTGTSTQTITLPSTATLTLGWPITITNNSTGNLSVQTSTAVALGTVLPGTTMEFTCIDTAVNTAAAWDMEFTGVQTVTGTGALVLATSPTLVTPALGTPASGNFTVGTFSWPNFNQNTSGTAANVTGTVAAANGGTGQTTYAVGDILYASTTSALSKLADVATGSALISGGVGVAPSWGKVGLTTHISGTLAVGNGGTGATTLTGLVKGNGTSAFTAAVAGTDYSVVTQGTAVATTSGTSFTFSSIPSTCKRIIVSFKGVTYSASQMLIQIGPASIATTGYVGAAGSINGSNLCLTTALSAGFQLYSPTVAAISGSVLLTLEDAATNTWCASGSFAAGGQSSYVGGYVALAGTLTQVKITTVTGTATFSAGSVNIQYVS